MNPCGIPPFGSLIVMLLVHMFAHGVLDYQCSPGWFRRFGSPCSLDVPRVCEGALSLGARASRLGRIENRSWAGHWSALSRVTHPTEPGGLIITHISLQMRGTG